MPTLQNKTLTRQIVFPIKLLDQGQTVADLQRALGLLQFGVSEREVKERRFGRLTRQEVIAFQKQQNLKPTGQIDEATAGRLNEVLTRQGFLPAKSRPFRDRNALRFKIREIGRLGNDARDFVRQRLNGELKDAILRQFDRPSEALEGAVRAMDLDYEAVMDEPLNVVLTDRVVPALLDRPEVEEEVEKQAERGFPQSEETVTELLSLDSDIRLHPLFREETRRAKTAAIGGIVKLKASQIEAIEDLDIDVVEPETLQRLVASGVLNERAREDLKNTVELARLTDDKFEVIEALRGERLRSPSDLIALDKAGWRDLLARHQITPPENDDLEGYATLLDQNVQRAFRTPYLMNRLIEQRRDEVLNRAADLEPLLARNEVIFTSGGINEDLNWGEISGDERVRLEDSLGELNRFANTYSRLGIAGILNDRSLSTQKKQGAIRAKQSLLQTFHRNNPDLDLDWVNVFNLNSRLGRAFQPNWENISEEDRPQLRQTLMAFQRTQRLTENFDESEALLASGLDSALAILKIPEAEFAKRVKLDEIAALRIYRKASDAAVLTGHALSVIEESTTHAPFLPNVLKLSADSPNLEIINVLKDIDGYQDLFGNQNYCRCKHCRSIFGPAAYFVDLMDLIDNQVSKPVFVEQGKTNHPLYLKNRRSDLWTLVLSCKNTDTRVPYLTIVNEVLERYLEKVFEEDDIYEALTEARLSFYQPFNLPFEELCLYLTHFGVSLTGLYEMFSRPDAEVARVRLGCSTEEFRTIFTPAPQDIEFRFGNPEDILQMDAQQVIRSVGVTREELDRLFRLDFVKGNVTIEIEAESHDLIGFSETVRFRQAPDGLLVLLEPEVRRLLDRLHRFVRLWRKLPWTPEELHLMLVSVLGDDLVSVADNASNIAILTGLTSFGQTVVSIADLRFLQDALAVSVEELCALYSEIPTVPVKPDAPDLFTRLFGAVDSLNVAHPALGNSDPENPAVSPDFGILQGALRLSETEVVDLISTLVRAADIQTAVLGRPQLSRLYRHARTARLLGLSNHELLDAQSLLGLKGLGLSAKTDLQALLTLTRFKQSLDVTPFSFFEAHRLISGSDAGGATAGAEVDAFISAMRDDPNRLFNAERLAQIEGLTLADAETLLARMSREDVAWVEPQQSDSASAAVPQAFSIAPAYGLVPDFDTLATLFQDEGNERMAAIVHEKAAAIRDLLSVHHPQTLFINYLTQQFNITQAYLKALSPLLSTNLSNDDFVSLLFALSQPGEENDPGPVSMLIEDLKLLLFLFQEKTGFSEANLAFVTAHPELFQLTLPPEFTFASLRLLSIYNDLRPTAEDKLEGFHEALLSWTGATFLQPQVAFVATLLQTDAPRLESLLLSVDLASNALDALASLKKSVRTAQKLGLDGAAMKQLTATDYAGLRAAKSLVYGAIRAKYDEDAWLELIEPYNDKLNEIKRDALVDRILSKEFQLKFKDARELYQFFLLDVEMEGCARTSRVLEAISACQLYVHRCRMNLEQSESGDAHVLPDSIPEDQWLWRKNYRVWEANRKVFLYPENWLEPDLRDNKTPIFKQVESELLQSTITPEAIEKIYRNYLREYAELSKLIVVSTLYDDKEDAYLFFARTPGKPYQYYWRKFLRNVEWTPWWKIELEIEPPVVSAHKHHGKLYLFWTRVLTNNDKDQGHTNKSYIEDNQTIYLEYSVVETTGRWITPQRIPFHNISVISLDSALSEDFDTVPQVDPDNVAASFPGTSKKRLIATRHCEKVYADTAPNDDQIHAFHFFSPDSNPQVITASLDEYANKLERKSLIWTPNIPFIPAYTWGNVLKIASVGTQAGILVSRTNEAGSRGEVAYEEAVGNPHPFEMIDAFTPASLGLADAVTNLFPSSVGPQLIIVHNRMGDFVLSIANQQFFVRRTGGPGYKKELDTVLEAAVAYANRKRDTIRLSTTLADKFGEVLFNQGLESFLSLETQEFTEAGLPGINFEWIAELPRPADTGTQGHLNFAGAQGPYFEELFFHLPFLIAHYLNASQKFADADYWYRRVFDPTASENPEPQHKTDRNWRYIEFRNRGVPKLREILTDQDAIERYKEDPFNPFAIARLRILAFQKAIVMKYVDNLLDWGDDLFAQDAFESINEATMLYVMAADILGERPRDVGDCETTTESLLTYQNILSHQRAGSEFLVELENLQIVTMYLNTEALQLLGAPEEDEEPDNMSAGFVALRSINSGLKNYSQIKTETKQVAPAATTLAPQYKVAAKASAGAAASRSLAFCIPPNENLLAYWDRVEDRLFKIRNCMNLQGVRRQLALFQPPIDPGLLVKAKAAGLSLEDVLSLLTAEAPAYRFTYLLEKAKQFAGTVQSFGSSLLSALEKKDTEELTLLRAVHEQELLKAVRAVKEGAITEATHQKSGLEEGKDLATKRKTYYANLLTQAADPQLAISKNEQDSLDKQEDAKENEGKSSKREQGASGINAAPFIGFSFRPLEIKIPFHPFAEVPFKSEIGTLSISYSTAHVASALSASASKFRRESSFKNIESNRAATRGGHERRKQEWKHQQELARQEENQFNKQILAADLRIQLAEKDLGAHDKQLDQSEEVHEFFKDKFTNLGLYTHLATSLSRLYREAYNLAHDMAMKAQRAYQFETDDQTFLVANENWEADKAGLLAGERLILQLQRMENAYLDQNRREYEVTLPCSLAQINPRALIDLRETGRCDFSVPEVWFDLYYPGQYKRRMKSARLTIPCVTGPYANVSAKLTLTGSRIRPEAQLNSELIGVPHQRNTSVAASTANNDSGVFELNFRDERYVPFEGAGAVSDWSLELPSVFRPFDYDTISDVILHISYTAKDDGRFREEVEGDLAKRFGELAAESGLTRWFSMKREFAGAMNRLRHPPDGSTPVTEITLDERHFPYFLRNREIRLEQVTLILKPDDSEVLDVENFDLQLNNAEGEDWVSFPTPEGVLRAKTFALGSEFVSEGVQLTIAVIQGELSQIEDIGILVDYSIQ
jgi:hypothetical protein